jgi:hypothetical protein
MAEDTRSGHGPLERTPAGWFIALVLIRVVILGALIAGSFRSPVTDVGILRAQRIAASPATLYRNIPVEFMPLQTLADRLLGTGSAAAVVARIGVLAFLADLGAAAALGWGWGRGPAAVYLLLGLPLLGVLYLRFDLVSVALAAWAMAWIRHRGEGLGGGALGLAVMAKLWPIVLVPILWLRRSRQGLIGFGGVVLVLGAWWYLTGGPKGPFQVLSFRNARGWHTQSVVGDVLWLLGRGVAYPEADALRIGHAATWAKGLLFLGLVTCEMLIWRRAGRDGRDPVGGSALAATVSLAVFSPLFATQYAAWFLPWTAIAFDGDRDERVTASVATVVIALTGLVAVAWSNPTAAPGAWVRWLVLARNLAAVGVVVSWLGTRSRTEVPVAA